MKNKNTTNIRRYRWLSGVYDRGLQNNPLFERPRRREFDLAQIQPDHHVLLVGIGTGLDIPYLPTQTAAIGIDLSPAMLEKARKRATRHNITFYEMSAERLGFSDSSFDVVIMNCILNVVEEPRQALREATRVLRPSGSIWVMGKFYEGKSNILRDGLNRFTTSIAGLDIAQSLDELIKDTPLRKNHAEPTPMADVIQLTRQ